MLVCLHFAFFKKNLGWALGSQAFSLVGGWWVLSLNPIESSSALSLTSAFSQSVSQSSSLSVVSDSLRPHESQQARPPCPSPSTSALRGPLFFFFSLFYFNWRLITLQYCGDFCYTFTWISHGYTRVPHPDPPSHLPPIPSLSVIPVHRPRALCLMHQTLTGDLFHIW